MKFEDRKYVILSTEDVNSIDFSVIMEDSVDNLRWSNDNTKTLVKYEGPQPAFLSGNITRFSGFIIFAVSHIK